MSNKTIITPEYKDFIKNLKQNILQTQQIALRKVNTELINLYYNIGKAIHQKQQETKWGDNFISQIEKDLKQEFPDMKGFSRTNLFYMKKFFVFFGEQEKIPQLVGQIPWGHIRLILDKTKDRTEAEFYIQETIENTWSRVILDHQIELNLYQRQGGLQSNFEQAVEAENLALVKESFKESYIFDFLNLSQNLKEKDLEKQLVDNICQTLLEFGKGFAFVGKQYKMLVGGDEFFVDLLFYNYLLKRFVIIELKTTEFKPEYMGQISFYMTVVDRQIKTESDGSTIGLIICKSKNQTVVEYALSSSQKPTGIAEYKLADLPPEISSVLPDEERLRGEM